MSDVLDALQIEGLQERIAELERELRYLKLRASGLGVMADELRIERNAAVARSAALVAFLQEHGWHAGEDCPYGPARDSYLDCDQHTELIADTTPAERELMADSKAMSRVEELTDPQSREAAIEYIEELQARLADWRERIEWHGENGCRECAGSLAEG